jgi:hypothetical protein
LHTRFDGDFGLSALADQFHEDWSLGPAAPEMVAAMASRGSDQGLALFEDALRLRDSELTAEVITTLWNGATRRTFDLEQFGSDGRAWMSEIADICVRQLQKTDPAFTYAGPEPVDRRNVDVVLEELQAVGARLEEAVDESTTGPIPGLLSALRQAVACVSPDLGFRLLLRTLSQYWVPLADDEYDRYDALGEQFGYGELLVVGLNVE